MIITTNLPLAQLKQETKIEKKRIYDRILERCIPVKIDGVSRREAMANDNIADYEKHSENLGLFQEEFS